MGVIASERDDAPEDEHELRVFLGLQAEVARFSFGRAFAFDWAPRLELKYRGSSRVVLRFFGHGPDRDSGESKPFLSQFWCEMEFMEHLALKGGGALQKFLGEQIRRLVMAWALHEVDEAILCNGTRPFDPHAPRQVSEGV